MGGRHLCIVRLAGGDEAFCTAVSLVDLDLGRPLWVESIRTFFFQREGKIETYMSLGQGILSPKRG